MSVCVCGIYFANGIFHRQADAVGTITLSVLCLCSLACVCVFFYASACRRFSCILRTPFQIRTRISKRLQTNCCKSNVCSTDFDNVPPVAIVEKYCKHMRGWWPNVSGGKYCPQIWRTTGHCKHNNSLISMCALSFRRIKNTTRNARHFRSRSNSENLFCCKWSRVFIFKLADGFFVCSRRTEHIPMCHSPRHVFRNPPVKQTATSTRVLNMRSMHHIALH